jgi:arabinose-5-phosphate isomerase
MANLRISAALDAKDRKKTIATAKRVLKIESKAVHALIDRIDDTFVRVVDLIDRCRGLVVITGVGKSGIIGGKIASTFSSIGVPSLFVHAAEASHGDLGMITRKDIVIAISNSGETEEILRMLPPLGRIKPTLVAMTGRLNSTLAQRSDYVLDVRVKEEAEPLNVVPTASTTATLAMGDALAIALVERRGFKVEDFANNHPGGSLGKKILATVNDLMHSGSHLPKVSTDSNFQQVIREMSAKRMGVTTVMGASGKLAGIITDGDLRRLFESKHNLHEIHAADFMTRNPKTIRSGQLATKAVQVMQQHSITTLAVIGTSGKVEGILHLHDLLKAGIV